MFAFRRDSCWNESGVCWIAVGRSLRKQMMSSSGTSHAGRQDLPQDGKPTAFTRVLGRPTLLGLLLVVAVVLAFGQIVSHEFIEYDDDIHIYRNPAFQPLTIESVAGFWKAPYEALYIPVAYTFFAVEVFLSPQNPVDAAGRWLSSTVFHAGSLLLHCICVLLVFVLLRRLIENDIASCVGSLIFALHPLQVESVSWISETRGLLCTAFGLSALWFYLRFHDAMEEKPAIQNSVSHNVANYSLATAMFTLALLSKPSAVSIPLVAAVIDIGLLRRPWRSSAAALTPWLGLALVIIFVSRSQQPGVATPDASFMQRVLISGNSLLFYATKVVQPCDLSVIYDRPLDQSLQAKELGWSWVALLVLVGLVAATAGRRMGLVCLGVFAAALLPMLGVIPFDYQRLSTVADRYAYLAMLSPSLAVAALLARYSNRAMLIAATTVVLVLAWLSVQQTSHWESDATLFRYALKMNPNSAEIHTSLGNLAYREKDLSRAESHYRRALNIRPRHVFAGLVLSRNERWVEALQHFQVAIAERPDFADGHRSVGHALVRTEQHSAAADAYREALLISPNYKAVYEELGVTLLRLGRVRQAETHYRETIARYPQWAHAHANLAVALAQQGKYEEAANHARRAIELDPTMSDARNTLKKVEGILQDHRTSTPIP